MSRVGMGAGRRAFRAPKRGGGAGGGLLLAGVAAIAGFGLIAAGANKKARQLPEYERVGADELPSVGDFERELEGLGVSSDDTPEGEAPRLVEGHDGVRIEVIDTTSEPAHAVS